ncbi:MAG: YqaA family protein [Chloroflexia bacterium]
MPQEVVRASVAWLRRNGRFVVSLGGSVVLTVLLLVLPVDYARLGNYGYLGVFLLTLLPSATVVFPSPTLAVSWIAGGFLSPPLVGLAAGLGATIGELSGYLAGYGGSALASRARSYERIRAAVMRYGWLAIAVLAFIPNPLFDLGGIAAGAVRMPLWQFLLACFVGKTLRFVLIAYLGRL